MSTAPAVSAGAFAAPVDDPLYYLRNFEAVVGWVLARYRDLLLPGESAALENFQALPEASRALLVRMIMRKGPTFRAAKLRYAEIGATTRAAAPLIELGWVQTDAPLHLPELFALLTKDEIAAILGSAVPASGRKSDWLDALAQQFPQPRPWADWCAALDDSAYTLTIRPLCDRLRLLFFGNLYQDWSEFVLSDLGVYRYETVEFPPAARAFHHRDDVDAYLHIHDCRTRFDDGELSQELVDALAAVDDRNPWIATRRDKLLFRIGEQCERGGELTMALHIYERCAFPAARVRRIRVLERLAQFAAAWQLCEQALLAPFDESEQQQLQRMLPRLQRHLGMPVQRRRVDRSALRIDLELAASAELRVELLVALYLQREHAPVYYVENGLINSLFGLLCWDAIFAPLPGAFFHPFQSGPADLHDAGFRHARNAHFAAAFDELDGDTWRATIRRNHRAKQQLQSPFVHWDLLDETLLELALRCIPAQHLRRLFERLLGDIRANRSGLPDLIQFWPAENRYRMIEVKGPGDRLQDNQVRWLDYCVQHGIPVEVCHVRWLQSP